MLTFVAVTEQCGGKPLQSFEVRLVAGSADIEHDSSVDHFNIVMVICFLCAFLDLLIIKS